MARSRPLRGARARGFTLTELMIVVTIVGVLATIGVYSVRRYVLSSKTTEAMAIIQGIRGAQEGWNSTTGSYLDVSYDLKTWFPGEPSATARSFWVPEGGHRDVDNWRLLNPAVTRGAVLFGYATTAGPAGTPIANVMTVAQPPAAPARRWYAIQAKADADGDGTCAYFVATSLSDVIQSENAGE